MNINTQASTSASANRMIHGTEPVPWAGWAGARRAVVAGRLTGACAGLDRAAGATAGDRGAGRVLDAGREAGLRVGCARLAKRASIRGPAIPSTRRPCVI